jgi:acetyl esterase/lipase
MISHNKHSNQIKNKSIARIKSPKTFFSLTGDGVKRKLPVMVWIHGGGFFAGSGNPDIYGPDYFMDYDVIVVTVNYRVGPLGFFTLENEEVNLCMGNYM